ncbi:hypothetical protein V8C35DRAFT_278624 [Trichoderma chlorosporum]
MSRIYSPSLLCSNCHYPGPSGWLYQCTQDREDLIEFAVARGDFISMDQFGCQLTPMMRIRKGSPAAREDRLSFFQEINQEQLAKYRPDQVAHILRQRENVQLVIQRDKVRKNSAAILSRLAEPYGLDSASCNIGFQKPWLCAPQEECQYRVCQNCRPGCADRAFLSLNAVADGEVPPTAAAGYSFHLLGQRPVVDADVLKSIGCRPVPLPQYSSSASSHTTHASARSVTDLLNAPSAHGRLLWTRQGNDAEIEEYDADFDWTLMPETSGITSRRLKYSPGCENLGVLAESTGSSTFAPRQWTPPPSLTNDLEETEDEADNHDVVLSKEASAQDGMLLSESAILQKTSGIRELSIHEAPPEATAGSAPVANEKFRPSPLKVPHGVAMLEESVELGVPDVITQA